VTVSVKAKIVIAAAEEGRMLIVTGRAHELEISSIQ